MKLGSLRNGGRDGTLVVVSRDLAWAVSIPEIAATFQELVDDWGERSVEAEKVYAALNEGAAADAFPLHVADLAAPLPRAYQWIDSSAYVNHIELVRKARGVPMPPEFWKEPILYQGGSDTFLGPGDEIVIAGDDWDTDIEAEVAVIIDDLPMKSSYEEAKSAIILVLLVNDISLRGLIPAELAKGFGFFHGKPPSALSPVAVTPDELGTAWDGTKISLPLEVYRNGELFGCPNAGVDMTFDFPTLISSFTRTRPLGAGTIIGAGTVSNRDAATGSGCIVERRTREFLAEGVAVTPFLQPGETIRIEMRHPDGSSIFGAIEQSVVAAEGALDSV